MTRRGQWLWACLFTTPPAAWAALIFVLSATSGERVGQVSDAVGGWRPSAFWIHFGEYALLGWLILIAMLGWRAKAGLRTSLRLGHVLAAVSVALATIYGATDEYHQSFVPGRAPEAIDLVADVLGATTAVVTLRLAMAVRALRLR